jgi:hypothetical protein
VSRKRRVRPAVAAAERGGLILPGHVQREEPLVGVCSTCDEVFYQGQEQDWQDHVYQCAMDNLPEIMAARAEQKKRLAIFHESWNPDVDEHLAKVGERMVREGRLVMRKNERIRNE